MTECQWRERGPGPGGAPATDWTHGRLLGFVADGKYVAIVATDHGDLVPVSIHNVKVAHVAP